jgi:predicted transcriptional regulator
MARVPEQLSNIAQKLKAGETPDPVTVRTLLAWFQRERRGSIVVWWIRSALAESGLVTEPDFDSVWIDGTITFRLATGQPVATDSQLSKTEVQVAAIVETSQAPFVGGAVPDPTHKIGKLDAANKGVIFVAPDDSLERAVTLMMSNSYSQLPIMVGEREVKGIVTWDSIARKLFLSGGCNRVLDCMEQHREIAADASLFAAIPEIVQGQYVLVRDPKDKRITGIVTAADLSLQFQQLAEPFLLLGEIEHQIRRLIENRFTEAELAAAKEPGDFERTVRSVADLSLGECIRLLENGDRWRKLGLNIDRREFIKEAHRVRAIRNDVMHFDPDPMGVSELLALRRFANFVAELSKFLMAPPGAANA